MAIPKICRPQILGRCLNREQGNLDANGVKTVN